MAIANAARRHGGGVDADDHRRLGGALRDCPSAGHGRSRRRSSAARGRPRRARPAGAQHPRVARSNSATRQRRAVDRGRPRLRRRSRPRPLAALDPLYPHGSELHRPLGRGDGDRGGLIGDQRDSPGPRAEALADARGGASPAAIPAPRQRSPRRRRSGRRRPAWPTEVACVEAEVDWLAGRVGRIGPLTDEASAAPPAAGRRSGREPGSPCGGIVPASRSDRAGRCRNRSSSRSQGRHRRRRRLGRARRPVRGCHRALPGRRGQATSPRPRAAARDGGATRRHRGRPATPRARHPRHPSRPASVTRQNPASLTARELDVLELVAEGLTNGEIAKRLFVSHAHRRHHVSAILRKLDVPTRARAVAAATAAGIPTRPA